MQRIVVLSAVIVLGVCGVWIHAAQQQTGAQPTSAPPPLPTINPENFIGKVTPHLTSDIRTLRYTFDPGARTNWHSHQGGQVIYVEEGRMRTQERGHGVRELGSGETLHTAPGVPHWHGALPGAPLTQVAMSFGMTTWMEKVSDEDYTRGLKR